MFGPNWSGCNCKQPNDVPGQMLHGQILHRQILHGQMLHGQMLHGQMLHGQMVLGHFLTVKDGSWKINMEKGADADIIRGNFWKLRKVLDCGSLFTYVFRKSITYCGNIWLNIEYLDHLDTINVHFHNNSCFSVGI